MKKLIFFYSITGIFFLSLFSATVFAQNAPNGQAIELLYSRTRCIECTFNGCISVRQDVSRVSDMNGSRIIYGPVEISVYSFPCACNKGPVIPEFKDDRGYPPYPWTQLNQVVTSTGNTAPIRGESRVTPTDVTRFYSLFKANRNDDEIFDLPEADLIRLIDKDWPEHYPKKIMIDGIERIISTPQIACGVAPAGLITDGGNTQQLNELLDKIKSLHLSGQSSDELDNWLTKIEGILNKLRAGNPITLPNGTTDIGKGKGHLYYGDCRWDFEFWNNGGILALKEQLPNPLPDGEVPNSYSDIQNVWRNTYPITNIIVTRLNDGKLITNRTYNLQRDITIDLTSQNSGDIINITAILFNGEIVSRKILIP
jgi:hypothetical protein